MQGTVTKQNAKI